MRISKAYERQIHVICYLEILGKCVYEVKLEIAWPMPNSG